MARGSYKWVRSTRRDSRGVGSLFDQWGPPEAPDLVPSPNQHASTGANHFDHWLIVLESLKALQGYDRIIHRAAVGLWRGPGRRSLQEQHATVPRRVLYVRRTGHWFRRSKHFLLRLVAFAAAMAAHDTRRKTSSRSLPPPMAGRGKTGCAQAVALTPHAGADWAQRRDPAVPLPAHDRRAQ
jgi:hypothetical protein